MEKEHKNAQQTNIMNPIRI